MTLSNQGIQVTNVLGKRWGADWNQVQILANNNNAMKIKVGSQQLSIQNSLDKYPLATQIIAQNGKYE